MVIDSIVKSGGEEILEADHGYRVDDDGCSIEEALGSADFEYIKCSSTMSGVHNGTHIMYLFTTGW